MACFSVITGYLAITTQQVILERHKASEQVRLKLAEADVTVAVQTSQTIDVIVFDYHFFLIRTNRKSCKKSNYIGLTESIEFQIRN